MMKTYSSYIYTIIGVLLVATGLILVKNMESTHGLLEVLPYSFIGVGCGIFGHGLNDIANRRLIAKQPDKAKAIRIEQNDERNITLLNRSKAKAYDIMLIVFGALMVCFVFLGVDMGPVLLFVVAYLFVVGYSIHNRIKLNKEM